MSSNRCMQKLKNGYVDSFTRDQDPKGELGSGYKSQFEILLQNQLSSIFMAVNRKRYRGNRVNARRGKKSYKNNHKFLAVKLTEFYGFKIPILKKVIFKKFFASKTLKNEPQSPQRISNVKKKNPHPCLDLIPQPSVSEVSAYFSPNRIFHDL